MDETQEQRHHVDGERGAEGASHLSAPRRLKSAGSGARNERNQRTEVRAPRRVRPNLAASFSRLLRGRLHLYASPVVVLADSLHHRPISAAPPARSARQVWQRAT